jgi:hypothetical protein
MNLVQVSGAYDNNEIKSHPWVDVEGPRNEELSKGVIKRSFGFRFNPGDKGGKYCIKPEIYLNGWWLLWPWNTGGCGNTVTISSGNVFVTLRVIVEQESLNKGYLQYSPLTKQLTGNIHEQGSIYYSSLETGTTDLITDELLPNIDTMVIIECEISADIFNYGWAIVDLGTTPEMYFEVPKVIVGPWRCVQICPPVPSICPPAPLILCPPAPALCPPAPDICPSAPFICPPVPLICPPAPELCPPAPIICPPAPDGCFPAPASCTHGPIKRDFRPDIRRIKKSPEEMK